MTTRSAAAITIGNRIKHRREELELSQTETSRRADMDASQYRLIESGRTNPGLHLMLQICHALELPIEELVAGLTAKDLPEDKVPYTGAELAEYKRSLKQRKG